LKYLFLIAKFELFLNFKSKERSGFFNISTVLIFPMKIVLFRYVALFLLLSIRNDDYRNPRQGASAADGGLSKNFLAPLYLGEALNLASIVSGNFLIPV
jgi:hypothetical protein